jgi:hypothetical protein
MSNACRISIRSFPDIIQCAALPLLLLCTVLPVTNAAAGTIVPGFDALTLAANDDSSTGQVALGFDLNLFGGTYDDIFVNNNGNVTFDLPLTTYTPFGLVDSSIPIIAPFFADVDTRGAGSGQVTYGAGTFNGYATFGVNWPGVGYYSRSTDKLDSFQLLIVDRSDTGAGNADIIFNYEQIQWESGRSSDGVGGLGGMSARAGYSNGNGVAFELPGSGVNGAFIDGGMHALASGSNDGVAGQYLFTVRNGLVSHTSIPGAFWLFASGILGLVGIARKRYAA